MFIVLLVSIVLVIIVAVRRKLYKNKHKIRPLYTEVWNSRDDIFRNAEENILKYGSIVPDVYDLGEFDYIPLRRTSFGYKAGKRHA